MGLKAGLNVSGLEKYLVPGSIRTPCCSSRTLIITSTALFGVLHLIRS
jgi:hypothetical protein